MRDALREAPFWVKAQPCATVSGIGAANSRVDTDPIEIDQPIEPFLRVATYLSVN
jgi:hypothetical protein